MPTHDGHKPPAVGPANGQTSSLNAQGHPDRLFRREALEFRRRGYSAEGHPLELSPRWIQHSYRLLLLVFLSGLVFSLLGSMNEYASGIAVVRLAGHSETGRSETGRSEAMASQPGAVSTVDVRTSDHSIVALFPGHYRTFLAPGMELHLELRGHPYAYQQLTIEAVSDDVVGPSEAGRRLGSALADAVTLEGPQVMVYASLPSPTFASRGNLYDYHEGLQGRAEVRVRSQRILPTLLPGLRALWSRHG